MSLFSLLRAPRHEVEFTNKASGTANREGEYLKTYLTADSSLTKGHYKDMQKLWQGCSELAWDGATLVTTAGQRSQARIHRSKKNLMT